MHQIIQMTLLLFSLPLSLISIDEPARRVISPRKVPSVGYCVLLENPGAQVGKPVRLNVTWQFGFETTSLHDRKCPQLPRAWLEFADENELCPETDKNRSAPGGSDKEADVTVVGRLYGPGRYGHLGDYQFKFVVTCMEKIKITSNELK